MTNYELVAWLKQGVAAWNDWRSKNPNERVDLSQADLRGANLRRAKLQYADLSGADLTGADLSEANLSGATLRRLKHAKLIGANLTGANLIEADLSGADLSGADLSKANLSKANLIAADLRNANLNEAILVRAILSGANLSRATLEQADLVWANLVGANLSEATFWKANLSDADFSGARLSKAFLAEAHLHANLAGADLAGANLDAAGLTGANLARANLTEASLEGAHLNGANLSGANLNKANFKRATLSGADLSGADLTEAILTEATLVEADLTGADLTGCYIYGVSAWKLKLEGAIQQNLVITSRNDDIFVMSTSGVHVPVPPEPEITVDNIEVAQFIYLMLNNEKVRDVIDTITSKAVLILGRFTEERKAVLDTLREELRKRGYLPILFDFAVPESRDITETVSLLARMARFIIADLTDPSSIPKELEAIVPNLAVPVQPLLGGSSKPYAMFKDYWKYDWVLPVYQYEGLEPLLANLAEKVIAPAEGKVKALEERRRIIEAELIKIQ